MASSLNLNPETLLKLTHLRGSITELILRSGARLNGLEAAGCEKGLAEEIRRSHKDLGSQIAELEILLDNLRRRSAEDERRATEEMGVGQVQIQAERFDVLDLEEIMGTLRRTHEAILYAKAPTLPLEKVRRLDELGLNIRLTRRDERLVLHLKSPVMENHFAPALIEIARALGVGEKPKGTAKVVPLGWGPALFEVLERAQKSVKSGEAHEEVVQESVEAIQEQLDDQISSLSDPVSLGLPPGCLRAVSGQLAALLVNLNRRGNVQVLHLSTPWDGIFLIDEIGCKAITRGPKTESRGNAGRADRFVQMDEAEA